MSQWIPQSAAGTVRIGPFLDTSGNPVTNLTIVQADIQISKNGGAFAQTSDAAPTTTHDIDGYYICPFTATDANTLGRIDIQITKAGALPAPPKSFMVVPTAVYAALVSGSDYLQVDAVQIEGADATDQVNAACDTALSDYDGPTNTEMLAAFTALNNLSAAEVNAECDTAIADAALATAAALSATDAVVDSIAALVTAILDDTNATLPAQIAALNNLSAAEVNAQVLDVLNTDTFAELSSIPAAATSLSNMIRLLYLLARNKTTQTTSAMTLRNSADSADIGTAPVSDSSGTFTKGAMS